jgi:DNA-binding IclR family transcriptional regulator
MPEEQALDILRRSKRPKLTSFTRTEVDTIVEELVAIRRDGFAIANQETFLGDISTAAPVFDGAGEVVGAVNIAVPTSRWSLEDVRRRLSPLISKTAASISSANGARSNTHAAFRRGAGI